LFKKCLTWQAALRIIIKCSDESDFGKCALREVTGKAKECVLNCLEGKTGEEVDECPAKVTDVRKRYEGSSRQERITLSKRVYDEIVKKHPEARPSTVLYFLTRLFNPRVTPEEVCKLYKELFEQKLEISSDKNRFIDCLKKMFNLASST